MKLQHGLFGTPSRIVMDPVHGGIPFFEHEAKVIDHPLFQRLRHIEQNDMLPLVFPGATHTRFQHSIGAMHIAANLFKSIVRSYLVETINARKKTISGEQIEAIQYFYFCLRLAALLHDTGHAPFSHQFKNSEKVKGILKDREIIESFWQKEIWSTYYKKKPERLRHEHYSARCAHQILKDVLSVRTFGIECIDVLGIMETTDCDPSLKFVKASKEFLSLFLRRGSAPGSLTEEAIGKAFQSLFQTIISGELDVDKMDYLLRDSYFSGCKYGIYNLDHLLSIIRVGYDLKEPWFGLAIIKKGVGALEDFVNSRFQLYTQLYSHKTVVGFKWLLKEAMDDLMTDKESLSEIRKALSDMQAFQHFTDTFFWEKFRKISMQRPGGAADRLLRRKKLKYLHSERNLTNFKKRQIVSKLGGSGRNITYWESESKFSEISKTYENLRLLFTDPFTNRRELDEIKRHSTFFDKFQDTVITHFYENPL